MRGRHSTAWALALLLIFSGSFAAALPLLCGPGASCPMMAMAQSGSCGGASSSLPECCQTQEAPQPVDEPEGVVVSSSVVAPSPDSAVLLQQSLSGNQLSALPAPPRRPVDRLSLFQSLLI
ncbi:MAG: hypothetical protein K0U98_13995 [Deltaproteobacteria bacterium]|nr:hypothetical protein [Deltaproteobacteria bacterium]